MVSIRRSREVHSMRSKAFGVIGAALLLAGCVGNRGAVSGEIMDPGSPAYPGAGPEPRPTVIRNSSNPSGAGAAGFISPARNIGPMPSRTIGRYY